ncbi:rhomboid family intramembrane serine protease [Stieleria sp. JC731]|uniref:rhomboid family intramembrane serine protease n=1 Tax=Pirellulaceae TaxID=2691357 RepID=UPI001E46DC16|nr:rhomboid family intramembrane serine protease [Stieleria sp. JC731]MCC9604053.1 rhomboid family intramembrane serine protease [Stieleria sp. JC731]
MRRIGTLTDPAQARRFKDYLYTLSIDCNLDIENPSDSESDSPSDNGSATRCHLWIRDEEQVEKARQELAAFQAEPGAEKYRVASEAEKLRKQKASDDKRKQQMVKKVKHGQPTAGVGRVGLKQQSTPVVFAIIALSVLASFSTGFDRPRRSMVPGEPSNEEKIRNVLSFVNVEDFLIDGDPYASIKKGEVWRLVTPIFLHGNTLHLAFNMMALFFLGSALERIEGSGFLLVLFFASAITGTIFQVALPPESALPPILHGLAGSHSSIGASGGVIGLFGYLWIRPLMSRTYPIDISPANVAFLLGYIVISIFFIDHIANGAHIGGLFAGMLFAVAIAKLHPGRFP